MMGLINNVVAWIFVSAFAAVVIGGILNMFGVIRISDPEQRKWVFKAVIAVIVVAVVGYGVKIFTTDPKPEEADKVISSAPPPRVKPKDIHPTTKKPKLDSIPSEQAPSTTTAVSEWAKLNMPTRPNIPNEFDIGYPACVEKLRADTASITRTIATQCRRDLELHKSEYISKYYAVKPLYDTAILEKQQELSRGRLTPEETEIFNFLISENEDLNFDGGKSLNTLNAAEARINEDIEFFRKKQ